MLSGSKCQVHKGLCSSWARVTFTECQQHRLLLETLKGLTLALILRALSPEQDGWLQPDYQMYKTAMILELPWLHLPVVFGWQDRATELKALPIRFH